MTDDFQLNRRAHSWIGGLRGHYRATPLDQTQKEEAPAALEARAFKIL
jgi:hypothetical protein